MSRTRSFIRRLRNRAIGLLVLAGAFAACRPDRLLDNRGSRSSHGAPTSPTQPDATSKPHHREPAPDNTAPPTASGQGTSGSVHLALGAPKRAASDDDYLMIKPQYALSYNRQRNVANWVSWNLDASYFGPAPRHKGKFLSDTSLPAGDYRVQDRDYAGSGFDRGHMVRSEERTRTRG